MIYFKFKRGIINLLKWFKIIWNDRNWDYIYIIKLLEFKIKLMEQDFNKNSNFIDAEKILKELKIVRLLCNKLIKDNYEEEQLYSHDKKWGELDLDFNNDEILLLRENAKNKEDQVKETKEFLKKIEKAEVNKKSDINFLFKFISRNIQKWLY